MLCFGWAVPTFSKISGAIIFKGNTFQEECLTLKMKKPHFFETWELLTQGYSVTSQDSHVPRYVLFNISHMQFIHIQNKSYSLLYIVENMDQIVYLLYKYSEVGVQITVSIELCWQSY
jgi:hypothetical protein